MSTWGTAHVSLYPLGGFKQVYYDDSEIILIFVRNYILFYYYYEEFIHIGAFSTLDRNGKKRNFSYYKFNFSILFLDIVIYSL